MAESLPSGGQACVCVFAYVREGMWEWECEWELMLAEKARSQAEEVLCNISRRWMKLSGMGFPFERPRELTSPESWLVS